MRQQLMLLEEQIPPRLLLSSIG